MLIFANPHSGWGRSWHAAERAATTMRSRGNQVELVSDRAVLARLLASPGASAREVWVCGGDGTLGELANRLPAGVRPIVGILPTGTGNVVARSLAVPLDVGRAIEVAANGIARRFDLWRVNGQAFTFMVSAGLDAEIAAEVAARRVGPMRRTDWVKAALRAKHFARESPFRVHADGRDLGTAYYAALFNCGLYAGSFRVCPAASFDDGRLHLLLLRSPIRPRWGRVAWAAWRGRPHLLPDAELHAVSEARLTDVAAAQVDGDPAPGGELCFALDPQSLRLRSPR